MVDALALEVEGVDIARGRAEGPLLPTLEALLRSIARVVAGAPLATVALPDAELELAIHRRGGSALLTVVAVSRPSHVLARDVEVELEELAAAALEASAELCRELSEVLPEVATREARRLRAAARDLRRTEAAPPPRPRPPGRVREPRLASRKGRVALTLELADDDALLVAYEGGRPDLGSLLAPGRLCLHAGDGREIFVFPGIPFLVLRDLGAATDRLLAAILRGDRAHAIPLSRAGRAAPESLLVEIASERVVPRGAPPEHCPPLELARAFCEAAAELARVARVRNPRQAENGHLAELEASAADRLAQIEELAEGDRAPAPPRPGVVRGRAPVSQRALGPGALRRLSFRKLWSMDVGVPAGDGLYRAGGVLVAAGANEVRAVERPSGRALWRREGAAFAAALPGAILISSARTLAAHATRSGRARWARPVPGGDPCGAAALARGPYLLVEPGALTALDPGSGRTLWRFEPPGATRLGVAAFGGMALVTSDTGALYGLDAGGTVVWRVRARGPIVRPPSSAWGLCLATSAADPGASLLAVDPTTGARLWEVPLEFAPSSAPLPWGRRLGVVGSLAGDVIVSVLDRSGSLVWTVAPPLLAAGQPSVAVGPRLHVADARGALVALDREGHVCWSLPARPSHAGAGQAAIAVARGTVVAGAGEGLLALDARTGEILGGIPGIAASRIVVDASLGVEAIDVDGAAAGWGLATHLSLI